MATSVGALSAELFLRSTQSKPPTRRSRFVVEVRSLSRNSSTGIPELLDTSSHCSSWRIGPEVPLGGSCTRIGKVRQTIIVFRTRMGEMPASDKQPLTLVSREVT